MSTPAKRKAGTPLSDVQPEAKPTAPGPSSLGPKEKSPTPGPAPPQAKGTSTPSSPGAPTADQSAAPDLMSGAHWLQQQLNEADDDEDSTLGSDAESSTASVSSSIFNYRTLHGRTYHSESVTDNEYWGPNDSKHIDALDIYYHGAWLMLGEKLHQAPIKGDEIKHAVDIGTGSGLWAIDFADKYTTCAVIGTDISPIQPGWCPPNLDFQIDDATKPWTFKENHFDYVHIMFMNGSIADWDAIYQEAYRCCKPGGWIEHVDVASIIRSDDDSIIPGSAIDQYGKILVEAGKKFGRSASVAEEGKMESGIKDAGFVNQHVKTFKVGCVTSYHQRNKQLTSEFRCPRPGGQRILRRSKSASAATLQSRQTSKVLSSSISVRSWAGARKKSRLLVPNFVRNSRKESNMDIGPGSVCMRKSRWTPN